MDRKNIIERLFTIWPALLSILAIVIILKQIQAIWTVLYIKRLYYKKRTELQHQYLELIKKKNEFKLVSSPAFIEKQIRDGLGYYKKGEKVVIFTEDLPDLKKQTNSTDKNTWQEWKEFLIHGIQKHDR